MFDVKIDLYGLFLLDRKVILSVESTSTVDIHISHHNAMPGSADIVETGCPKLVLVTPRDHQRPFLADFQFVETWRMAPGRYILGPRHYPGLHHDNAVYLHNFDPDNLAPVLVLQGVDPYENYYQLLGQSKVTTPLGTR